MNRIDDISIYKMKGVHCRFFIFESSERERARERDQLKRVGGFDSELSIYSSYHNLQSPIYGNISKRSTLGPLLLLTFSS